MEGRLPEVVDTDRLKRVRVEIAVGVEFFVNDRHDAALGAYLRKQLANDARPKPADMLYLPSESEVRDDFGRNLADASERAVVRLPRAHGSHRVTQIRREPRCSEGKARNRGGLDAGALVVIKNIYRVLLLGAWCRLGNKSESLAGRRRRGFHVGGEGGRHSAAAGSGAWAELLAPRL